MQREKHRSINSYIYLELNKWIIKIEIKCGSILIKLIQRLINTEENLNVNMHFVTFGKFINVCI